MPHTEPDIEAPPIAEIKLVYAGKERGFVRRRKRRHPLFHTPEDFIGSAVIEEPTKPEISESTPEIKIPTADIGPVTKDTYWSSLLLNNLTRMADDAVWDQDLERAYTVIENLDIYVNGRRLQRSAELDYQAFRIIRTLTMAKLSRFPQTDDDNSNNWIGQRDRHPHTMQRLLFGLFLRLPHFNAEQKANFVKECYDATGELISQPYVFRDRRINDLLQIMPRHGLINKVAPLGRRSSCYYVGNAERESNFTPLNWVNLSATGEFIEFLAQTQNPLLNSAVHSSHEIAENLFRRGSDLAHADFWERSNRADGPWILVTEFEISRSRHVPDNFPGNIIAALEKISAQSPDNQAVSETLEKFETFRREHMDTLKRGQAKIDENREALDNMWGNRAP